LLTLVIENRDRQNFAGEPENFYVDKEISITGKIALYKGQPQIAVRNKDQIMVKSVPLANVKMETANLNTGASTKEVQPKKDIRVSPDVKAIFPGGTDAMARFLKINLICPEELDNGDKKQVIVRFVVNTDGSISDLKIMQSAGNMYDLEVIRVLKLMPKWTPQFKNGVPVTESIMQPITFSR
jgi:protein TonB